MDADTPKVRDMLPEREKAKTLEKGLHNISTGRQSWQNFKQRFKKYFLVHLELNNFDFDSTSLNLRQCEW
jgi:DNA topoisomerase IA